MKVWITRDKAKMSFQQSLITIWETKPKINTYAYISETEVGTRLSMWDFESLFGFTPRKGSCKQYELSLKEIK